MPEVLHDGLYQGLHYDKLPEFAPLEYSLWESAYNKVEDIEHDIEMCQQQLDMLERKRDRHKEIRVRTWNRLAQVANAAFTANGFKESDSEQATKI
jgi:hypothetical protein